MNIRAARDWKYLVMLAITVAGVFSPIWITYLQTPEKQVVVREISQSALLPISNDSLPNIKIMLNGTSLENPFLTVFEIQNIGGKPISARDFEAPLEITIGKNLKIISAKISEKSPTDIASDITWEKNAIRIAPTLLNPQDRMTISVLSTGGIPELQTNARIAGVSTVPVIKSEKNKPSLTIALLLLAGAFFCAIPGLATYLRWEPFSRKEALIQLRSRTVFAASFVLQFGTIGFMIGLFSLYGMDSFWSMMLSVFIVFGLSLPFSRLLESQQNQDQPTEP